MSTTRSVRRHALDGRDPADAAAVVAFVPATYPRLVPAAGTEMPHPGTRIVAGTLVDATAPSVVQLTGSIR